jgi:hypothetical protein
MTVKAPEPGLLGREEELAALASRLAECRSFLLHGPAGVGKTRLLEVLLPQFSQWLYCPQAPDSRGVFQVLAAALREARDPILQGKGKDDDARSALALKGIVTEALRAGGYGVVLDHLSAPSKAFAADLKELTRATDTPLLAVARSAHMEDAGFLLPFFADRRDRFELRNFDRTRALAFTRAAARASALTATNLQEFLERAAELSRGNPGALLALLARAREPRYRSGDAIKITPLYIDFRLEGVSHG